MLQKEATGFPHGSLLAFLWSLFVLVNFGLIRYKRSKFLVKLSVGTGDLAWSHGGLRAVKSLVLSSNINLVKEFVGINKPCQIDDKKNI